MVKDELRKLLNQPYTLENWKKVTEFVFPNVSYFQKPQIIPIKAGYKNIVDSFNVLGYVRLHDGKNLAIFEIKVTNNVSLTSNRVQLRQIVAEHVNQETNHGVLAIYDQDNEDYRFTFTAKSTEFNELEGDFKNVETDAKRFTYILGKNESCKTAADRFWELSGNKDNATIKDVEQAFSVERLNKEFFDKYKSFYEDFVQHITGKRFEKEKGKWIEKTKGQPIPEHKKVFDGDDKVARNFVKLLLGRLVFIQFLQKKGWMGVSANSEKWKDGEKDFLNKLFTATESKDKFHSDVLFELFYRAFNTPNRPNDIFSLTGTRVPYLNGGLFENEYLKTDLINFPESYFQNLLDFFGQYNFTIDENDPLDHEVGIDPEMLGHIFENLLEDNKDKGAFYTPKPIVQYMCQESLIEYLRTYLNKANKWPTDSQLATELEEGLQNFVRKKLASSVIDFDEQIAVALRDVKVCDPAIGSGAFPMGLLNEIFYCIQVLYDASPDVVGQIWSMREWQADVVKKNIIQHSIYGVDLDKGAVDIARLRFWLSLIVDETEPYPLPNLDFKIIQGNSLLESYEGIDLSKISGNKISIAESDLDLFGNPKDTQTSIFNTTFIEESIIIELIENYFNAQIPAKKQELKQQIDLIIHEHIKGNLKSEEHKIHELITDLEFKLKSNTISKTDSKGIKEKKEKVKEKLTLSLNKIRERLKNLQTKRKDLLAFQNKSEKPYFLWHLFFKDVFDSGGFDIVIGNPPYVQLQKMGKDCSDLEKVGFKTFQRTGDIYCLFYELGCEILKPDGILSYITSNKWMRSAYGESLRKYFIGYTNPLTLIDFSGYQVFETATVDTNILILKKSPFSNTTNTCILGKGFSIKNMSDYFRQNGKVASFDPTRSWVVLSALEEGIRNKIESAGTQLKDWDLEIYRGVLTGYNEAFIIDSQKRSQLIAASPNSDEIIRPILLGRNIKRYSYEWENLWIINSHNGVKSKNIPRIDVQKDYPIIYNYLLDFKDQLQKRLDQGDHWTNLRNCAYIDDFAKPKVAWGNLALKSQFCYIPGDFIINAPSPFFTTENFYILAILNSKIADYYIKQLGVSRSGGYFEYKPMFVEHLPIPDISEEKQNPFKKLVTSIFTNKLNGKDTDEIELRLDEMIFELYDLNEAERNIVKSSA